VKGEYQRYIRGHAARLHNKLEFADITPAWFDAYVTFSIAKGSCWLADAVQITVGTRRVYTAHLVLLHLHVADDLSFPARAVTETFGILAVRGAGKSNTAAVMAEEMFKAKLPFVVVDPVRAWYGLRASADGTGPGLPIPIFGGRRGDVPLERGAGNLMADLIVDQRLSCVLDLSDFDSEGSKKTFLLDFARRLYQRNEQPLHLFLEEADDYIPQRPMRDEAQLLRAWENIVRHGRNRGLGITLITQRSASVNKNVLTQVQTLIAMRTTGPHRTSRRSESG
jgi:DNA helicase HerA-like ATPase